MEPKRPLGSPSRALIVWLLVPGGGAPGDGVGLLRPGAVDALFVALGNAGYDYVVVDAPGLLSAPEAWLVARNAEAAIVACEERPSPEELAEVRRALERLDVRVLGAVSVGSHTPAATATVAVVAAVPAAGLVDEAGRSTRAYQYQSATRAMMMTRQPALRKQPFM